MLVWIHNVRTYYPTYKLWARIGPVTTTLTMHGQRYVSRSKFELPNHCLPSRQAFFGRFWARE